jgi:thioredoxin-like negative regulator of GroEL
LAREYSGRIVFKAFNFGEDPQLAEEFNVEVSPTVLLIIGKTREGRYIEYRRFEGSVDKEELRQTFDEMLGSG